MACRKLMFVNNHEKSQKLPIFGNKIKTRHQLKNLRHSIRMFSIDGEKMEVQYQARYPYQKNISEKNLLKLHHSHYSNLFVIPCLS